MIVVEIHMGGKVFDEFERAADHFATTLREAPDRAAVLVSRELLISLHRVATNLSTEHTAPWNGRVKNDTDKLQRRTGDGVRSIYDSIRSSSVSKLNSIRGEIAARGYMAVHEEGATIRARKSKYLTIPLPAALDARGVPLRPGARDWPNTFVATSRKGNLIIFQRRGKEIVPLYLLKESVRIPRRLSMEKEVMGVLPYFTERALDAIASEIKL